MGFLNIEQKIASPLSRKCVLVAVNISMWSARKLDRKVTDEVNREHNASKDAGRYNKLLIEKQRLAKLTELASAARLFHYRMTRPWADEGPRILPNVLYHEFAARFREFKRDFEVEAERFCRDYPAFVEERRAALNGLFDAADYPAPSDIRSKFNLDLTILPMPEAADFRSDLDPDTVADIKAEIEAHSTKAVDVAMAATVAQINETVGRMAERLREYRKDETGTVGIFRDSLVENVRELAKLLPAFNLTNDPHLDAVANRIRKELCFEDASELRENANARKTVAKSAESILADVSKFLA